MNSSKARTRLLHFALGGYWLMLFTATHIPSPVAASITSMPDKPTHFMAYGGLAMLFAIWWQAQERVNGRNCAKILGVLAAFAAFDEISQIPVGRSAEFRDWIADLLGVACGLVCFRLGLSVFERWRKPGSGM